MKNIYVNKNLLDEAVSYLNSDITFFGFLSHVKSFLKDLLTDPLKADVDDYLKENGLDRNGLLNLLLSKNIIEKDTKINSSTSGDKFSISFKVPKRNFERKIRRLYTALFEKHEVEESKTINETDCGSAMQCGGSNPDSGQFITPLQKVQRRKIYITNEQIDILKETTTTNVGNYQYDVPLNFNDRKDPAYNHKNIISQGVPNKKIGIRTKRK